MEKLFRVDSVENLLTKQEKLVWKVDPLLKGKEVLERSTEVDGRWRLFDYSI